MPKPSYIDSDNDVDTSPAPRKRQDKKGQASGDFAVAKVSGAYRLRQPTDTTSKPKAPPKTSNAKASGSKAVQPAKSAAKSKSVREEDNDEETFNMDDIEDSDGESHLNGDYEPPNEPCPTQMAYSSKADGAYRIIACSASSHVHISVRKRKDAPKGLTPQKPEAKKAKKQVAPPVRLIPGAPTTD